MNEVLKNIFTRRSTRTFSGDKSISDEDLMLIIKAGLHAPSAINRQSWKFSAVCNEEKIQRLCKAVGDELDRENYNMYNPKAIIITSNKKETVYGREDNACAMQNMMLAAHSIDIGSVWINQVNTNSEKPEIRKILKEFGVPDENLVYGVLALGYDEGKEKPEINRTGEYNIVK